MPRATKTTAPAQPLTKYSVRLHAIGGGKCEFTGAILPTLEETLTIEAASPEAAAKRSKVFMTIPVMGQLLRTYVDGVEILGNF
jgi:hypothetical protein